LKNKIERLNIMAFTVGQSVNITEGGVTTSATVVRVKPLGSANSVIVKFADNSQKGYFGSEYSKVAAA